MVGGNGRWGTYKSKEGTSKVSRPSLKLSNTGTKSSFKFAVPKVIQPTECCLAESTRTVSQSGIRASDCLP